MGGTTFGCNPPAVGPTDVNCSGGGFSKLFSRPAFQASTYKGAHSLGRGVPDVAYNAGVSGGVLIFSATINVFIGLPSNDAGGDQLAGRSLGDINPALYAISRAKGQYSAVLHDITIGNSDVSEIGGGYDARAGWHPGASERPTPRTFCRCSSRIRANRAASECPHG